MARYDLRERIYGPADVCEAIGIERGTFHSWLARRYVDVASQGAGRARRFDFGQVVLWGAIAELHRHGMPVGSAADHLKKVQRRFLQAVHNQSGRDMILTISAEGPSVGDKRIQPHIISDLDLVDVAGHQQRVTTYTVMHIDNLVLNICAALERVLEGEL